MLEFKKISLNDYTDYCKYREKDISCASEAAFTTIYIWNGYYNLECAKNDDFFFLRFNIKGKAPSYFFPVGCGDIEKALCELCEYAHSKGEKLCFRLVSKENRDKLRKVFGDKILQKESRDSFDYMYLTEKMISLSGKKLHSKRNHLNYFLENYNYQYIKIQDERTLLRCADKAYELIGAKTKNKNPFEMDAMKSYFENYFNFNQTGACIEIDGDIRAMSFGEQISPNTALIQIELADDSYRGAYQAINKMFCENEWKHLTYVNREEDMGIEGLRKAKMSYQPEFLVKKYYLWEE